jgi:hypothetical protein
MDNIITNGIAVITALVNISNIINGATIQQIIDDIFNIVFLVLIPCKRHITV